MTRKHFETLAWELRNAHPSTRLTGSVVTDTGSDWYAGAERAWDLSVLAVADACAAFNGAFDRGRFLVAAGYSHRPDGSMFRMVAPR